MKTLSYVTVITIGLLMSETTLGAPQVGVTPTRLTTTETGIVTSYEVSLNQAPSPGETVTVTPTSTDASEGAVSGPIMFNRSNWRIPQNINVSPQHDFINDGDVEYTILNTVSAVGGTASFDSVVAQSVNVTNQNVDGTNAIIVDPSSGSGLFIEPGEFVDISVRAIPSHQPANEISIGISTVSTGISLSKDTIILSAGNNFSTTFRITANPNLQEPVDFTVVTEPSSSADSSFNGINPYDVVGKAVLSSITDDLCFPAKSDNGKVGVICL